jgi:ATP-binding cassette, subfamily B, multidrug efflux pump
MSDRQGNKQHPVAKGTRAREGGEPGFGFGPGRGGPMGMIGVPTEKARNFRISLKRLVSYLKPYHAMFVAVFLLAVASTAFSIFAPKIMGNATTRLFEGLMAKMEGQPGAVIDFAYVWQMVILLIVLYVVSAFFSYIMQYIMASVSQKTVYEMRKEVNEKLARLPLSFYDGRTHGEILSLFTNDMDNIANMLQLSLTQVITSVVMILGIIVMMIVISPMLTTITIIVLPLSLIIVRFIAPKSQKHFKEQWQHLGTLNGHVEEMYTGHAIVKAFGHERKSIEKFNAVNEKLYDASWRAQFISGLLFPFMALTNNLGYVAIAVAGGIMVTSRAIAIGDIQAFIQYSRQFTMPITQTAQIANILQSTIASAERVFELLDQSEEQPDRADAALISAPKGEVRFENVTFSYTPDAPLIADMGLDVKQGQTVAIVGPTGAGKTTLVNLLMRFYELQGGRITVDGVDIRDLKRGDLRSAFGMVLQDTWLFNGTIRENIAYGLSGVSDEEVHNAAVAAHADHFIRTLPDGYATVLTEDASNISQGQRQLLAIARAVLIDPPILILDEATSSVDTRTEVLIQKAMARLMKGRTSFVIAHRLSTIRDAKTILVMNHGKIIETGNHKELLAKGGFYAELYNSQFTGADIEVEEALKKMPGPKALGTLPLP